MNTINRRGALKLGIATAAGTALYGGLAGCVGVVRRDFKSPPGDPGAHKGSLSHTILEYAAMAPSGHNTQPWRVHLRDAANFALYVDNTRRLPEIDPDDRELRMSLGGFIENLVLASGALGRAAEVVICEGDKTGGPIATIRLEQDTATGYSLERIERRCTVRHRLASRALPASTVAALIGDAGASVRFISNDSAQAAAIRNATLEAFRQQSLRDAAQRELSRWIRFDDASASRHRDGLTPASMGITGFSGWIVRKFYKPDDVMSSGFRKRGIDGTAEQVQQAGGWFVVSSPDSTTTSLIAAGRAFARMALRSRELGVGLHPMEQALEEEPYRTQILSVLAGAGVPQIIVRAGFVDTYPEPVSLRRPVDAFVTTTSPQTPT